MSLPPIPTRGRSDDGRSLLMEVVPALARVTVELPREHQRLVSFCQFCPARIELEKIVGREIIQIEERLVVRDPEQFEQFVWLSRLVWYSLELADETHQLDGKNALDFASGFIAGEKSSYELFGGPEVEAQALAAAIDQSFLRAGQSSPFVLGFQTRRDQRRADAADGKENA